jgi:predicted transcriptional regulator
MMTDKTLIPFVSDIVASYVSQNQVLQADLPNLIRSVHAALNDLLEGSPVELEPAPQTPAVPIRKSITDEYIICLEDGAKLKMLKGYIRSRFNLTPEQYRTKWKLPPDYPIVAPSYARLRSDMAKRIGLGRKPPVSGRGRKAARKSS